MKKISFLALGLFVFTIAYAQSSQDCLRKYFTKSERKQLSLLTDSFDKQIMNSFKSSNYKDAYAQFFEEVSNSKTTYEILENINFIKKDEILENINDKTILKIWNTNMKNPKENSSKVGRINLKGVYLPLLKQMGIKYPIINEYYESIIVAGDLSPYGIKLFQMRQKELPITDEALRLILAIHYLSF